MEQGVLKINTGDKINVYDVFITTQHWIVEQIVRFIKFAIQAARCVFTLTWAPLLARTPADSQINKLTTYKRLLLIK